MVLTLIAFLFFHFLSQTASALERPPYISVSVLRSSGVEVSDSESELTVSFPKCSRVAVQSVLASQEPDATIKGLFLLRKLYNSNTVRFKVEKNVSRKMILLAKDTYYVHSCQDLSERDSWHIENFGGDSLRLVYCESNPNQYAVVKISRHCPDIPRLRPLLKFEKESDPTTKLITRSLARKLFSLELPLIFSRDLAVLNSILRLKEPFFRVFLKNLERGRFETLFFPTAWLSQDEVPEERKERLCRILLERADQEKIPRRSEYEKLLFNTQQKRSPFADLFQLYYYEFDITPVEILIRTGPFSSVDAAWLRLLHSRFCQGKDQNLVVYQDLSAEVTEAAPNDFLLTFSPTKGIRVDFQKLQKLTSEIESFLIKSAFSPPEQREVKAAAEIEAGPQHRLVILALRALSEKKKLSLLKRKKAAEKFVRKAASNDSIYLDNFFLLSAAVLDPVFLKMYENAVYLKRTMNASAVERFLFNYAFIVEKTSLEGFSQPYIHGSPNPIFPNPQLHFLQRIAVGACGSRGRAGFLSTVASGLPSTIFFFAPPGATAPHTMTVLAVRGRKLILDNLQLYPMSKTYVASVAVLAREAAKKGRETFLGLVNSDDLFYSEWLFSAPSKGL